MRTCVRACVCARARNCVKLGWNFGAFKINLTYCHLIPTTTLVVFTTDRSKAMVLSFWGYAFLFMASFMFSLENREPAILLFYDVPRESIAAVRCFRLPLYTIFSVFCIVYRPVIRYSLSSFHLGFGWLYSTIRAVSGHLYSFEISYIEMKFIALFSDWICKTSLVWRMSILHAEF